MEFNQDDSMEDCLLQGDQVGFKENVQGTLVTHVTAFHPEIGHINITTSELRAIHLEKVSPIPGSGSQVAVVKSAGKLDVAESGKDEAIMNKECTLVGNDEQLIVHGVDGPFLMNKNRWPNLSLHTEQDSQSQEGLGDLT
jgi:hypothetical protein